MRVDSVGLLALKASILRTSALTSRPGPLAKVTVTFWAVFMSMVMVDVGTLTVAGKANIANSTIKAPPAKRCSDTE